MHSLTILVLVFLRSWTVQAQDCTASNPQPATFSELSVSSCSANSALFITGTCGDPCFPDENDSCAHCVRVKSGTASKCAPLTPPTPFVGDDGGTPFNIPSLVCTPMYATEAGLSQAFSSVLIPSVSPTPLLPAEIPNLGVFTGPPNANVTTRICGVRDTTKPLFTEATLSGPNIGYQFVGGSIDVSEVEAANENDVSLGFSMQQIITCTLGTPSPTQVPTRSPSISPTKLPSLSPTFLPTNLPTVPTVTAAPTPEPSAVSDNTVAPTSMASQSLPFLSFFVTFIWISIDY